MLNRPWSACALLSTIALGCCASYVHGRRVGFQEANEIIEKSEPLIRRIGYLEGKRDALIWCRDAINNTPSTDEPAAVR